MNKIKQSISELKRLEPILIEAESTGKILVHSECGDNVDPYPIFFTSQDLVEEINKGSWHFVNWYLMDKQSMKKEINDRIQILQERLMRL